MGREEQIGGEQGQEISASGREALRRVPARFRYSLSLARLISANNNKGGHPIRVSSNP